MTYVSPDRSWNTWSHRYPACFVHVPSGFAVKLSAYSGKENRYEDFSVNGPSQPKFGLHASDGGYAECTLGLGGTLVRVEFAKPTWSDVVARVRVVEPAELYFRFVLIIEAGYLPLFDTRQAEGGKIALVSSPAEFMPSSAAISRWRSRSFCVAVSPTPVGANSYDDLDDLRRDFEERGWLYQAPVAPSGRWTMFRYLGDPKVDVHVGVASATDDAAAAAAAHRLLEDADATLDQAARVAATGDAATLAVRDVMAWNTVWDGQNSRPYTCLTRGWVDHLGGWGVWFSDVLYNALLNARVGDWTIARANLSAVLNGQQPSGVIPCLMAGFEEWVDRTQLPIPSYITWRVYLLTRDRVLLAESYEILRRYNEWWFATRDGNGNGLLEYGSSPTGRAHNTHTKQGAMNESGMDNMPIFDDATFNEQTHTLEFEEVGHNSLLALDTEMLAAIARELGRDADAETLGRRAADLRARIQAELWDPDRRIFAGRFWSGGFARQLSPTSFFPLAAGAASAEQADALIEGHLLNEDEFWGPLLLPSTPYNDPISEENSYWRGRVWAPLNFFTWEGLRRYGRDELASELAERSWQMFNAEWEANRHCHENFHIRDPHAHESPDSDPFYSWGALIPLMKLLDAADVSPWSGMAFSPAGETAIAIPRPGRTFSVRTDETAIHVDIDGAPAVTVSPPVRIRGFEADERGLSLRLSSSTDGSPYELGVVGVRADEVLLAAIDATETEIADTDRGLSIRIGPGDAERELRLVLRSPRTWWGSHESVKDGG